LLHGQKRAGAEGRSGGIVMIVTYPRFCAVFSALLKPGNIGSRASQTGASIDRAVLICDYIALTFL
jgi:hypothetical protein